MRLNKDPRISVNLLCEYVDAATAQRRNSIIKNCKIPVTYITKWYNLAEDLLSFYLSSIRDEPKVLLQEAIRLSHGAYADEMERKFANTSADALKAFLENESKIRIALLPYTLEMAVNDNRHKFILNGVQISLRPELLLRDECGKQQLGFVKFYFSKNEELKKNRGELIACLTKHYFEQEFGFTFKTENCFVLDVYRGVLFTAPKAYKRHLANILASCNEIADRWDKVLV